MSRHRSVRSHARAFTAAVVIGSCSCLVAGEFTWVANGNGDWTNANLWDPTGGPPKMAGDKAIIKKSGTTLTLNAGMNLSPTIDAFTLDGSATTTAVAIEGVTLTVNGPSDLKKGKLNLSAMTWDGNGTLTNDVPLGSGGIFIQGKVTFKSTFVQKGSLEILPFGGQAPRNAELVCEKSFTNAGRIRMAQFGGPGDATAEIDITGGTQRLTNSGTILIEQGTADPPFARISARLTNSGMITVADVVGQNPSPITCSIGKQEAAETAEDILNTGTISIGKKATIHFNGLKFRHQAGGYIQGAGQIDYGGAPYSGEGGKFGPGQKAPQNRGGTVDPSELAVLTIAGDWAGHVDGSLDIQIGGGTINLSDPDNEIIQYDRLAVVQNLRSPLAGALNLSLVNGYDPAIDSTPNLAIDVLTAQGGISGHFSNTFIDANNIRRVITSDGNGMFEVVEHLGLGSQSDPGYVRLQNFQWVPEPHAGAMLLVASVLMNRRCRNRRVTSALS